MLNIRAIRRFFGRPGGLAAALPRSSSGPPRREWWIVREQAAAIVALATRLEERKGQVIVLGARDAVRVTLGLADFTKTKQGKRRW